MLGQTMGGRICSPSPYSEPIDGFYGLKALHLVIGDKIALPMISGNRANTDQRTAEAVERLLGVVNGNGHNPSASISRRKCCTGKAPTS